MTILDCLIHNANVQNKNLFVAFLDLRKAFDSVSHFSLIRALSAVGLPAPLVDYFRIYYSRGSTELLGVSVPLRVGVWQGDPLLPLLFNLVINEALRPVDRLGARYLLNGEHFSALSFADDLVLIADSRCGLQDSCDAALNELALCGLYPNNAKCATLAIVVDSKKKKWFCDAQPFLLVGQEACQALSVLDSYKYLGVEFTAQGKVCSLHSLLAFRLDSLRQAPLKPQQHLIILCHFLIPSLLHRLVLGKATTGVLRRMDRMIHSAVHSALHLLKDTA